MQARGLGAIGVRSATFAGFGKPISASGKSRTRMAKQEADIERGLMAMAVHNGNSRKARDFLAQGGIKVGHQTLREWALEKHVERYEAIRAEYLPKLRARAAEQHMDLARLANEANAKVIERLSKEIDEIPTRDLPGASRNLAVTAAVNTEKGLLLDGEPTSRVTVNFDGLVNELKGLGVEVIDIDPSDIEETGTEAPLALPEGQSPQEDAAAPETGS